MLPSWFPTIFGVEDKVPVTVIGTCGFGSLGVPGHPEISTIGVSAPTPAFSFIPPVSVVSLDTFIPYFTAPVNIDTPPTKLGLDDLIPAIQIGRNIFPPASEIVAFPIDPRVFYPTQETKISIETLNPECKARILKTENIFG
ncbi:MAG: hypothetical protein U9R60_17860, partial [Bacteroidota bacterium]|nr:hypothetical protein [Bacteroidota bacterium]